MKTSLTALVRLTTLGIVVLIAIAVVLGSWAAPRSPVPLAVRRVNNPLVYVATAVDRGVQLLDVRSGRAVRVDLTQGESIEQVSCSPWEDAAGHRRLVGRWCRYRGEGIETVGQGFGLAMIDLPSGRCLAQIDSEIWPVAPPCWYPQSTTRVLFAAGDGRLYHFDFAALEDRSGLLSRQPDAVEWAVPGVEAPAALGDPNWISTGRAGDILVATVYPTRGSDGKTGDGEIWWLRLDDDGVRIEEAGRLTAAVDERDGANHEEARPVLKEMADGDLVLIYQTRRHDAQTWELRSAVVSRNAEAAWPRAGLSTVLDQDRRIGSFAVSPDGQWVFAIHRNWASPPEIRRLPLQPVWLARGESSIESIP